MQYLSLATKASSALVGINKWHALLGTADSCCHVTQVAAERHNEELREVCVDITSHCLPDVLVSCAPNSAIGCTRYIECAYLAVAFTTKHYLW